MDDWTIGQAGIVYADWLTDCPYTKRLTLIWQKSDRPLVRSGIILPLMILQPRYNFYIWYPLWTSTLETINDFTGLVKEACPRLRDPASWLPLASSRNLWPTLRLIVWCRECALHCHQKSQIFILPFWAASDRRVLIVWAPVVRPSVHPIQGQLGSCQEVAATAIVPVDIFVSPEE